MTKLAVDPGPHVGVAYRLTDGTLQTTMFQNQHSDVWKLFITLQPSVVIIERFRTAGRISNDGQVTVEIQGGVFALAWMVGASVWVQSPGERMAFLDESRRLTGSNKTKIQSHAVDALAHLLHWEWASDNNRLRPPLFGPGEVKTL